MPVIIVTWEAEISKIKILGHYWKKKLRKTTSQWIKLGIVVHAFHPIYTRKNKTEGSWSRMTWGKKGRSISKIVGA
jgi:hypothetical protein